MVHFWKALIVICFFFIVGYGDECTLSRKIDEVLCKQLHDASADDIIKFRIILKRPDLGQGPDKTKSDIDTQKEWSKFVSDSLNRYLKENKEEVFSLLTSHVLYTVDSDSSQEILTEKNATMDWVIPAAGTRETILSLAEASDLINHIEYYFESHPLINSMPNRKLNVQLPENNVCSITIYSLNGRIIRRQTDSARIKHTMKYGSIPSQYVLSLKSKKRVVNQRILIMP